MYLAAQHVRSALGQEGINAFRYTHGGYVWQGLPPQGIPDPDPGVLVEQIINVPPPGNVVRSYLDVVAPDEVLWPEIRPAFFAFVGQAQRQPLPWQGVFGRCYFRAGMDMGLAATWRHEVARLLRALEAVYPARSQ
ncbi:MAG TPA: hypothetical protein VK601_25090 [Kofleriaceae bacterium]|nr:hypothetical protein [Kofleriaceae bacterium]